MVSKTRDKLIEVARQLFVNKGVENTTMNDIAAASEKGRRTIYTYFKNKREIYDAVLESESNAIICRLREVIESDLSPIEKLRTYLVKRFDVISPMQNKHKTPYDRYRALFSKDARRIEKIYELARKKEHALFVELIEEGVADGSFDPRQAERLPYLMSLVFLSADHIRLNTITSGEYDLETVCEKLVEFVTEGITIQTNNYNNNFK